MNSSTDTEEGSLIDVFEEVLPIQSAYFTLGRALRIDSDKLKSIKKAHAVDAENALSDVLELWLKQEYDTEVFGPPTWRMLVEAVYRRAGGNNHDLAKEIASNHPVVGRKLY